MVSFGRTNQSVPRVWLSLSIPHEPEESWVANLVGSALDAGVPIDVSSQPALWGSALRSGSSPIMTIGPELSGTPDREGAARWIQAHIIETLSATGHETIDFYFLKVTRALEEYQIDGALSALEELKQEGNIRFVGLFADGPALAALGLWQFHDAFEAVLLSNNPVERETYQTLAPMAAERRTGILGLRPLNWGFGAPFSVLQPDWTLNGITAAQAAIHFYSQRHPVLVGVRTPEEVVAALAAPSLAPPEGIGSLLEVYAAHYRDPESWAALVGDQRPWVRQAALKAMNSGTRGAPVNVD